jgi:hypothetical protein
MNNTHSIHVDHKLDSAILDSLADFICGDDNTRYPVYRSSYFLTIFFQNIGINVKHDGSTRKWWTFETLKKLSYSNIEKIILRLTDLKEYKGNKEFLKIAINSMNEILLMDNLAVSFEENHSVIKKAGPINLNEDEIVQPQLVKNEENFLKQQFPEEIKIEKLGFDAVITTYLQNRVNEIISCQKNKVALGSIFLLGSTLEGILLATALNNQSIFMSSASAPKDKKGNIKQINNWKLSELIDVSYNTGFLGLDVKRFSHILRDFRNYIHPYHQMSHEFNPDQHTVDICWQVFKSAFNQLHEKRMSM